MLVEQTLQLPTVRGPECLKLRGLIYSGGGHFTCRVIQPDGRVWFHDGMISGRTCIREFEFASLDDRMQLYDCRGRRLLAVVYAAA
ncbi:hypothetical protein DFH06DRAFT_1013025 [Mycena polygramma]|nr:hypothetical protein DFH06DRAFT_1013025 [Mycena polygramma]